MAINNWDGLVSFLRKDTNLLSISILRVEEDQVPAVEKQSEWGTSSSGYSNSWSLLSEGQETTLSSSGSYNSIGGATTLYRGDEHLGFMVLKHGYSAGFSRDYPPTIYHIEIYLFGSQAEQRQNWLENVLEQKARRTPAWEVIRAEKHED